MREGVVFWTKRLCSLEFWCWNSNVYCHGVWTQSPWEVIRSRWARKDRTLITWDPCRYREETPECFLPFFFFQGDKVAVSELGRGPHQILAMLIPWPWNFTLVSLWDFVTEPELTNTVLQGFGPQQLIWLLVGIEISVLKRDQSLFLDSAPLC